METMLLLSIDELSVIISEIRRSNSPLIQADGLLKGIPSNHAVSTDYLDGKLDYGGVVLPLVAPNLVRLVHFPPNRTGFYHRQFPTGSVDFFE